MRPTKPSHWTVCVQWSADKMTEGFDAVGQNQREARQCVLDILAADGLEDGRIVGMIRHSPEDSELSPRELAQLLFVPATRS